MSIAAVIITLNEEMNIERCLKSLTWVDEIIIYDSGSKDRTIEKAQQLGARVYSGPWLGFGPTKREASLKAQSDWILSLDADEEVSDKLKTEILILKTQNQLNPDKVYQVPRLSFYMNRWIRYGGWYPDYQIKLFNKSKYNWNLAPIHEKVEPLNLSSFEGSQIQKGSSSQQSAQLLNLGTQSKPLFHKKSPLVVTLKNDLHHFVFKNIEHQVSTNNKYSSLQAQEMFDKGKTFNWFHYWTKPYVKFLECYLVKLGFLDGWPGFVIARNAAYSVLLKWTKLRELQKAKLKTVSKK